MEFISRRARSPRIELEIALFIIIILTGVYVAYELITEPRGGHPFGHWLGIIGTLLMVMTETLYSIRKRTRLLNRTGPVRGWLSFHIVTGLVGPFLVLMHTGLEFRGLAGFTMVLTMIVVASGFVGRYLYASLQRVVLGGQARAGTEQERQRLKRTRQLFRLWHIIHVPIGLTLFVSVAVHIVATIFFRAGIFK